MKAVRRALKVLLGLLVVVVLCVSGYLAYASATAAGRMSFKDTPYPSVAATQDAAAIGRGKYLVFGPAHCAMCHSVTDRSHPEKVVPGIALSGGLEFAIGPLLTMYSANLTPDSETGIGRRTDADLARTLRTGVLHDGRLSVMMRVAASDLSEADISDVISFLRAQAPVKNAVPAGEFKIMGKAMLPLMKFAPRPTPPPKHVPAGDAPSVERGEYLADHVALCSGCHTVNDKASFAPVGPKCGGGSIDPSHSADHDMEFQPPNLTSDPSGYTGRVDEAEFIARIKRGRAIESSIMPWECLKSSTDNDLRSIYRYLRSLPPVKNDLGPSYRKLGWKPEAAK
jgi:mono/diheme cytochrome c family protein